MLDALKTAQGQLDAANAASEARMAAGKPVVQTGREREEMHLDRAHTAAMVSIAESLDVLATAFSTYGARVVQGGH